MKIYLGGKMTGHDNKGNWRDRLVDGIDVDFVQGEYFQAEGCNLYAACGEGAPPEKWPVIPKAILGKHDYVGPFLVGCDHGCFHGGDHATSMGGYEDQSSAELKAFREANRKQITSLCLQAMTDADILFFWLDSLDAYGTLAEMVLAATMLGMANAIDRLENSPPSVSKHIFVASSSFEAIDEMWLAFRLVCSDVTFITATSPKEALLSALEFVDEAIDYSPIEKMFIDKWRTIYGNGISPQYNVPGFRYRVDFAFPSHKVAVELDGYEYHNSKEQFTNDRKRQREMELAGWRFIRFSGSEVYNNAEACVRQAYEFWQSITKERPAEA